jgi:hypothetical protein
MFWMCNSERRDCIKEATALSAPHHGSSRTAQGTTVGSSARFSILENYLKLINPQYHIISSGEGNKFLHPKSDYIAKARLIPGYSPPEYKHQIYRESSVPPDKMTFEDESKSLYTTVTKIEKVSGPPLEEKKVSYIFTSGTPFVFKAYPPNQPGSPYLKTLPTPPAQPRLSFSQFTREHKGGGLWI